MNGKWETKLVHRLVAGTFIDNPLDLPQVNLIDANKTNNRVPNLEWVDNLTNHRKATEMGLIIRGAQVSAAKLTDEKSKEILSLFGKVKQTEIAKRFNISSSVVSSIKHGVAWKHVRRELDPEKADWLNKNASRKLTPIQVKAIKERLARGESTYKIAPDYNVSQTTISGIKRGIVWKEIKSTKQPEPHQ